LVVAQPEEAWLPQATVVRPLGESDLGDELGPGPVRAPGDRPCIVEPRFGRLQRAQPGAEPAERRRVVPRPDLPGVSEPSVLVIAHEQRAEVGPAAGGIGVTADHELLLPDAFELQP